MDSRPAGRWCWRRPSRCASASNGAADGPPIYAFAAVGGENLLLAALGDVVGVHTVPRLPAGGDDLEQFLRTLDGSGERIVADRARETGGVAPSDARRTGALQTSRPSWRGCGRAIGIAATTDRKQALALASRYHLVTPVSGAVVLESQGAIRRERADPRRRKPGPHGTRAGHVGADRVARRWRCWSRASRMLGARRAI